MPLSTSHGNAGGEAWYDIQPKKMPPLDPLLHKIQEALIANHCWVQIKKSGAPTRVLKAASSPAFDEGIANDNVFMLKHFLPSVYSRLLAEDYGKGLEGNFHPGTQVTAVAEMLIGSVRYEVSDQRELYMDPRCIVGDTGGYAHFGVVTGQFTLLVEWGGDVQELHKVHIKKAGVKWSHQPAANMVGPSKWDSQKAPFEFDAQPRNYPIQGPTWENFMPTKALIAYMPGANFPVTVAIHLTRKGDHVGCGGAPTVIHQHLLRLDVVPAEFDHVFAQPTYNGSVWGKKN